MRILVADKLADEGLEYLQQSGVAFDVNLELQDQDKFAGAIKGYDALIVRSGVKVTPKVIEASDKLRAIARDPPSSRRTNCRPPCRQPVPLSGSRWHVSARPVDAHSPSER